MLAVGSLDWNPVELESLGPAHQKRWCGNTLKEFGGLLSLGPDLPGENSGWRCTAQEQKDNPEEVGKE